MTQTDAGSEANLSDPALWLRQHGDYLFAFAMAHTANLHLAEDLVQETLLAAMEGWESFESRSALRTWLAGILKHKLTDHLRRMNRGSPPAGRAAAEAELEQWVERQFDARGKWRAAPGRWDQDPAEALAGAELRAALAECLQRLPVRAAQALLLTDRQELSAERVGKFLDLTPTNVGVILHRARTSLRRCLEERWIGRTRRDHGHAPM